MRAKCYQTWLIFIMILNITCVPYQSHRQVCVWNIITEENTQRKLTTSDIYWRLFGENNLWGWQIQKYFRCFSWPNNSRNMNTITYVSTVLDYDKNKTTRMSFNKEHLLIMSIRTMLPFLVGYKSCKRNNRADKFFIWNGKRRSNLLKNIPLRINKSLNSVNCGVKIKFSSLKELLRLSCQAFCEHSYRSLYVCESSYTVCTGFT